jgi:anti-sigma regulatory factor (Ser/Thr protein kinase)
MTFNYDVPGDDFTRAGEASGDLKKKLKKLGFPSSVIRRVSIALYEGEINMVIHANGGHITADVNTDEINLTLADVGPGIPDIEKAMQDGYSTATDQVRNLGFGAGMGLPNMKRNSDEISIETELGVGTTVRMKILNQ